MVHAVQLGRRAGDLQDEQEADQQGDVVRHERRCHRGPEDDEDGERLGIPAPRDQHTADRDKQAEREASPRRDEAVVAGCRDGVEIQDGRAGGATAIAPVRPSGERCSRSAMATSARPRAAPSTMPARGPM